MDKITNSRNKLERQPHKTLLSRLREEGSHISGGIQPRHEDKDKDSDIIKTHIHTHTSNSTIPRRYVMTRDCRMMSCDATGKRPGT